MPLYVFPLEVLKPEWCPGDGSYRAEEIMKRSHGSYTCIFRFPLAGISSHGTVPLLGLVEQDTTGNGRHTVEETHISLRSLQSFAGLLFTARPQRFDTVAFNHLSCVLMMSAAPIPGTFERYPASAIRLYIFTICGRRKEEHD